VTVAVWVVVAAAGAAIGRLALPRPGLRAHYFTNLTRSGTPDVVTIDESISTDTLDNGTAGVWPAFSVEWTGAIVIDTADTYQFSTVSDDGSELEVADQVVVRNGGSHGAQEATGRISLPAGIHPIRLRYEQLGGGFALSVNWARGDQAVSAIPSAVLLPDPISYNALRVRRAMPLAGALAALLLWIAASHVLSRRGPPALLSSPVFPILDRPGAAIALLIAVAVGMRIFMMLGSNAILWGDSDVFIETFGSIRNGRFFEHDPFRTLLYPYFLSAFLIWSGEPPMDQIIVGAQHLVGVITAVAMFAAGRAAFGTRVALAGSLLFAVHTTELFYENSILSESLFACVLALCLLIMLALLRKPSTPRALAAGFACVVLTMTRPIAEWFIVVPMALGVIAAGRWPQRVKVAAAMAAIYVVCLLPWAALNQRTFGFSGVALGRGLGLFIRTFEIERFDPPADTKYPEVRDMLAYGRATQYSPATFVRDELRRRRYSTAMADDLMYRSSLEAVEQRPVAFAIGSVRQWWRQLGGPLGDEQICTSAEGPYVCSKRTIGYSREPFLNRPRHADEPVRPLVVAYFRHFRIPMHVVSALAAVGAIACAAGVVAGDSLMPGLLLALTAAYFTFLPAAAQSPQDRYRVPVDGLLFLLAAFGATRVTRRLYRID
jgi:hypothetical protein